MHHAAVSRLPALYARLPPQLSPPPAYVAHRIQMYDGIKAKRDAELKSKERTPIKVTLRDGKELDGRAWETTPFNIAESLSKSLANNTVIAKVRARHGPWAKPGRLVWAHAMRGHAARAARGGGGGRRAYVPRSTAPCGTSTGRSREARAWSFWTLTMSRVRARSVRTVGRARADARTRSRRSPLLERARAVPAQHVFWHSSAHILGEACERCYGCLLEHGPPTDDGFFYDMRLPE